MNKKVSIIVPVYNVEQYLERCVNSLIQQTYQNIEIILVDDGSPDKCPLLCDKLKERDNRIKVIHKTNGGLSSARNVGLDNVNGEFISFVDSDDYVKPDMIEKMVIMAQENNLDVVCCGRIRKNQTREVEMFTLAEEIILTGGQAIRELFIGGCVEEAAWDKLYRSNIFEKRRFPIGEINEDIVQTVDILGACDRIGHIGKAMYYYCENSGSITKSGYKPNKIVILKHLDQIKSYIEKKDSSMMNLYHVLEVRYCQSALYLLLNNKETFQKYQGEYKLFYDRFRKAFTKKSVRKYINSEEKIKGWLIYFKLYYFVHEIKMLKKR